MTGPLLALGAAGLAACGPPPAGLSAEDQAAVRMATDRQVQAALAGDYDSWAAVFADRAVLMPPDTMAVEGREAIRNWARRTGGRLGWGLEVEAVDGSGDLAITRGEYWYPAPRDPQASVERGPFLAVWHRTPGGAWQMVATIWNRSQRRANE